MNWELNTQGGNVYRTFASVDRLREYVAYESGIGISEGLEQFVTWLSFYK